MIVRSYTGRNVNEALERVRADLGEDALIIETRSVKESDWDQYSNLLVLGATGVGS